MAMENGTFINVFPIETAIHRGFVSAMFDYQRVNPMKIPRNYGFPMGFLWFSYDYQPLYIYIYT